MQQFHGFLKKKHEIAKAVQEVTSSTKLTHFLDSPLTLVGIAAYTGATICGIVHLHGKVDRFAVT
jgi:uncharacterized membrane protein